MFQDGDHKPEILSVLHITFACRRCEIRFLCFSGTKNNENITILPEFYTNSEIKMAARNRKYFQFVVASKCSSPCLYLRVRQKNGNLGNVVGNQNEVQIQDGIPKPEVLLVWLQCSYIYKFWQRYLPDKIVDCVVVIISRFITCQYYCHCKTPSVYRIINVFQKQYTPKCRVLSSHYARCGHVTLCVSK